MNLEELRTKADELMNEATGLLKLNARYLPTLFVIDNDGITLPVDLFDEEKDEMLDFEQIMEDYMDISSAQIVIMDTNLMEYEEDLGDIPESIEGDPRTVKALVCFLHTENESIMKQIRYNITEKSMTVNASDWEPMDEVSGDFDSPFTKNRKVSQDW